jgi:hypothetical protein
MFDTGHGSEAVADDAIDAQIEDALDWKRIERELRYGEEERTFGNTSPSGLFALEIDTDTRDATGLTDAQLIDAMVGFERLASWAQARQARVLAEFARRRPGDDPIDAQIEDALDWKRIERELRYGEPPGGSSVPGRSCPPCKPFSTGPPARAASSRCRSPSPRSTWASFSAQGSAASLSTAPASPLSPPSAVLWRSPRSSSSMC